MIAEQTTKGGNVKSVKELMEELGFNKEASFDVQKAFIKHLINAANQTAPKTNVESRLKKSSTNVEKKSITRETKEEKNTQLEFDFSDTKRVS